MFSEVASFPERLFDERMSFLGFRRPPTQLNTPGDGSCFNWAVLNSHNDQMKENSKFPKDNPVMFRFEFLILNTNYFIYSRTHVVMELWSLAKISSFFTYTTTPVPMECTSCILEVLLTQEIGVRRIPSLWPTMKKQDSLAATTKPWSLSPMVLFSRIYWQREAEILLGFFHCQNKVIDLI